MGHGVVLVMVITFGIFELNWMSRNGCLYVLEKVHENTTYIIDYINRLSGEELVLEADNLYGRYWKENRTFDFGGTAKFVKVDADSTPKHQKWSIKVMREMI